MSLNLSNREPPADPPSSSVVQLALFGCLPHGASDESNFENMTEVIGTRQDRRMLRAPSAV
jgi:hypothetical protein